MLKAERHEKNPVLKPDPQNYWEAKGAFNPCPAKFKDKTLLLYRALSSPHYHRLSDVSSMVSSIGLAESRDGVNFNGRKRFILPDKEYDKFGCEDPRVTKFNGKYYIFYTALSKYPFTPEGIKVAIAVTKDFVNIEKHPVTTFNSKAMALFPEKINGKMAAILTVNTDKPPSKIALALFDKEEDIWNPDFWDKWYENLDDHVIEIPSRDEDHIEVGTQPIKTKKGWIIVYSYIKNYFNEKRLFTFRAALLDLKNPKKIKARTTMPLLLPREYYENYGMTPNVIFPSGALLKDKKLRIYYGAADTTSCLASVNKKKLIDEMIGTEDLKRNMKLKRYGGNPIIKPNPKNPWEEKSTFNPAAFRLDGKVHILYRAMSKDNTSTIGYATSKDGLKIDERLSEPIYVPRESFEQKKVKCGNSGCEDPRVTIINDKIYMCYTAFDGKNPPRVAMTHISKKDFLSRKWNWSEPILLSPPNFDNKDAFLFPEKVNGKYMFIHRIGDGIDYDLTESLPVKENIWLEEKRWIEPREWAWDMRKVGAAGPPIKTKDGWIMLYHGVDDESTYRVGAVLLDPKDPTKNLARLEDPLLEPKMKYEKEDHLKNVVFPCGNVVMNDKLYIYYGAADKTIGIARIKLKKLLKYLKSFSVR